MTTIAIDHKTHIQDAFRGAMQEAFPDMALGDGRWAGTHEDVAFSPITAPKYPHGLGGIQLSIGYMGERPNARVMRRVMVKDNHLDLDSLRDKFEKLKAVLALRAQEQAAEQAKKDQARATAGAILDEVGIDAYGPIPSFLTVYPQGDKFSLKAEFITEAQLRAMLKAWKEA